MMQIDTSRRRALAGLAGLSSGLLAFPVPSRSGRALAIDMQQGAAQRLAGYLTRTNTLTATFVHEQRSSAGATIRYEGNLRVRRPGLLRWEIERPYRQLHLVKGLEFYFYDEDLAQLTIRPLDEAVESTPAGLLLSAGPQAAELMQARFTIYNLPDAEGLGWTRLVPKSPGRAKKRAEPKSSGSQIEVGLEDDGTPRQLRLQDALGRESRVLLSDVRLNPEVSKERFDFTPPPGTEIIRSGG